MLINMKNKLIYVIIFIILIYIINIINDWPDKYLHYIQCDVGQGDGILITQGNYQILFDAGKDDRIISCLDEYIPFWDKNIELAFISHADTDHFGGYYYIINKYNIDLLIYNGVNVDEIEWKNLLEKIKNKNIQIKSINTFDKIKIEDLVIINFDYRKYIDNKVDFDNESHKQSVDDTDNNKSIVIKIIKNKFSALLTGDISKDIEKNLIKIPQFDLNSSILKIAHHGSKHSSDKLFLEKVHPYIATIGVGKNSYGHPHSEVLNLLKRLDVKVMRTDIDGDIEIISDGDSITIP